MTELFASLLVWIFGVGSVDRLRTNRRLPART